MAFYTYIHIRKDTGQVFYVGKGKGVRAWKVHGRSEHWRRTVDKYGYTVEILASWPSEFEAFAHEIVLIDAFRDLGHPLINKTDGGEGHAGLAPSEQTRAKLSESLKRFMSTEESRKRRAENMRKAWRDPIYRERWVASITAGINKPENLTRRSEFLKAAFAKEEHIAKRRAWAKAAWQDPDYRASRCRRVLCITTGVEYESASAAARAIGANPNSVIGVCNGGRAKRVFGLEFRYLDPAPTRAAPSAAPRQQTS